MLMDRKRAVAVAPVQLEAVVVHARTLSLNCQDSRLIDNISSRRFSKSLPFSVTKLW